MGLHFITWGPAGETHDSRYVCNGIRNGHPQCLTDAIREHVSVQWAAVCDTVNEFVMGDTVYVIGYSSAESDSGDHVYCWACGELVSHGDGSDSIDRIDDRMCTSNGCTWPEYEGEPEDSIAQRRERMIDDSDDDNEDTEG